MDLVTILHRKKMGGKGDKRKTNNEGDVLKAVAETGKKYNWKGRMLRIPSCVWAFSKDHDCKLAYCPDCFDKFDETRKRGRGNRGERTRGRDNAAISTGSGEKEKHRNECDGVHIASDLKNLVIMDDPLYLKKKQKHDDVANACYDCGITFS